MRELESSLQQCGEFLLKAELVREKVLPYFVRWVRRFLPRPALDEPVADQVRRFCEALERNGGNAGWQVRQAEQALRIYFVNFLERTDWHRRPVSTVVDEQGRTSPLAALEQKTGRRCWRRWGGSNRARSCASRRRSIRLTAKLDWPERCRPSPMPPSAPGTAPWHRTPRQLFDSALAAGAGLRHAHA